MGRAAECTFTFVIGYNSAQIFPVPFLVVAVDYFFRSFPFLFHQPLARECPVKVLTRNWFSTYTFNLLKPAART